MAPHHFTSDHQTWHRITWHDTQHITSHQMTRRDMTPCTSHHQTWHDTAFRRVAPHHSRRRDMTPHHIIRHDMTPHDTKWHHMTWHLATNRVTWLHITSQPTTRLHLASQPPTWHHTTLQDITSTQPATTKKPPPPPPANETAGGWHAPKTRDSFSLAYSFCSCWNTRPRLAQELLAQTCVSNIDSTPFTHAQQIQLIEKTGDQSRQRISASQVQYFQGSRMCWAAQDALCQQVCFSTIILPTFLPPLPILVNLLVRTLLGHIDPTPITQFHKVCAFEFYSLLSSIETSVADSTSHPRAQNSSESIAVLWMS